MNKTATTLYNFVTLKSSSAKDGIIHSFCIIKAAAQNWWSGLFIDKSSAISYAETTLTEAFASIRKDTDEWFKNLHSQFTESPIIESNHTAIRSAPTSSKISVSDAIAKLTMGAPIDYSKADPLKSSSHSINKSVTPKALMDREFMPLPTIPEADTISATHTIPNDEAIQYLGADHVPVTYI